MLTNLPSKIQKRIQIDEQTDCWLWVGSINYAGYGQIHFTVNERGHPGATMAHRLVYRLLVGDPGQNLHHRETCPKNCVNPAHLTPMMIEEHIAHHLHQEKRTHCKHGHEFTEENTYIRKDGRGRQCRICKRNWMRNYSRSGKI